MVTRDGSGIANKAPRSSRVGEKKKKKKKKKKRNTKNILTAGISLNKYEDGAVWNLVAPTWRLNAPRVNKLVFNHAKFKEGRGDQFALLHASARRLICDRGPKVDEGRRTKAKKARPTRSFPFLSLPFLFDRREPPRSFKISERRSENKPADHNAGRVDPGIKRIPRNESTRVETVRDSANLSPIQSSFRTKTENITSYLGTLHLRVSIHDRGSIFLAMLVQLITHRGTRSIFPRKLI